MPRLPAFCDCGAVFESNLISDVAGAARVEIGPNVWVNCPTCGRDARVMPGVYDSVEGALRVLAAPESSLERLRALRDLLEAGRRGDVSASEALDRAEAEVPEATGLLTELRDSPVARLSLLIAIVDFVLSHGGEVPWDEIRQVVEWILSHMPPIG